ncbi:hypothetical protein U1Q18_049602 [Sarracenia purpurea var. burkii]
MAKIEPIVYNILNPGLATLQQSSLNTVIVQLWLWKIHNEHANGSLHYFQPRLDSNHIPLESLMPKMPPQIYRLIKEYSKKFGLSLERWLNERYYSKSSLEIFHDHPNDILNIFYDFVCGNDGTIHNVRTAKRMMLCDRISQQEKFQIACEYCFEDDVRRVWPSVSGQLDLKKFPFRNRPLEYYWICRIINQLSRKSRRKYFQRGYSDSEYCITEEELLVECPPHAWSSFQYFWHKLSLESQGRVASKMFRERKLDFAKFILPMLNEEQLDKFAAEKGIDWIYDLVTEKDKDRKYYTLSSKGDDEKRSSIMATWTYLCSRTEMDEGNFVKVMKDIFDTETEEHVVKDALNDTDKRSWYDRNKLDHEFETVCFCEIWSSSSLNLRLSATEQILRENRLSMKIEWSPFEARESRYCIFDTFNHLGHCDAINKLIEDAYESADLAIEFKKQFTSLPEIQRALVDFIPEGNFLELVVFVDTFVVTDETAMKLKRDFMKGLKSHLVNGTQWLVTADRLQKFIVWCLGDSDEVITFKQSISPVEVVHNTVRNKDDEYSQSYHGCFEVFLEWYFNTTDEIEQFKKKYSDVIEKFGFNFQAEELN